jgi:hypothetical protein
MLENKKEQSNNKLGKSFENKKEQSINKLKNHLKSFVKNNQD